MLPGADEPELLLSDPEEVLGAPAIPEPEPGLKGEVGVAGEEGEFVVSKEDEGVGADDDGAAPVPPARVES